jgi:hypothetical protein
MVQQVLFAILRGLKPGIFRSFSARLKSCPDAKRVFETRSKTEALRLTGGGLSVSYFLFDSLELVSKMSFRALATIPQGLKPAVLAPFAARLKTCPDTNPVFETCSMVMLHRMALLLLPTN